MNEPRQKIRLCLLSGGVLWLCCALCGFALPALGQSSSAIAKPSRITFASVSKPSTSPTAIAPVPASNRTLDLVWNASADPTTNYIVSYGVVSGVYTNSKSFGPKLSGTISNLTDGVRYYLAAQSQGPTGLVGAFSSEIHYPSNAIYAKILYSSTNGTDWHRELDLGETKEPIKLIRILNELQRWE